MADAYETTLELARIGVAGEYSTMQNVALDGTTNNRLGWVFQAETADTITHIGYRQGTTTGTPASGSFRATLYDVAGTGLPNADVGGGSATAATFQPVSGDDGKWVWVALTNSYTCTRGQLLACVIDRVSGTGSPYISLTRDVSGWLSIGQGIPYSTLYTSSWSRNSAHRPCLYGYKSASRAYGNMLKGMTKQSTSTSGRRLAVKFTLPSGWGTSYKIQAFEFSGAGFTAGTTYGQGIWNAAGTLLQGATGYDSDIINNEGYDETFRLGFTDTTLATLTFGTTYYIGVQSAGSAVTMYTHDFTDANDLTSLPLQGNACYSLWDGAAWTDTTTSIPPGRLILSDITPPAGGGGSLLTHSGMTGGIRG